jgi:hypothetical protein
MPSSAEEAMGLSPGWSHERSDQGKLMSDWLCGRHPGTFHAWHSLSASLACPGYMASDEGAMGGLAGATAGPFFVLALGLYTLNSRADMKQ